MDTYSQLTSPINNIRHYRHIGQLRTSMRRIALGKVGYVGDSSNRFDSGGGGDRYRPRRAGWLRATGRRAAVLSAGSERPTACRDAEHPLTRAGCATDRAPATRYK